ncbi:MAG: SDR family NAD(P)-dependent oxidoreductase [Mucilaginibacter sp.]|uniref:SDR family NAD(P)-dependent oxidoreductase n=1 Tax=Mucilaginibacter sp. TaxID=1882438 RepID=UPI0034E496C7
MDFQLKDKTALVTGSTAGIGYAIAKTLAQEGVHVYLNGRTIERVNEAVKKLENETGSANIKGVAADFSKTEEVENLIAAIPAVDILVNNVGIFEPKPFDEIADEDWLQFFEVNVMSGIRLSRAYLKKMLDKNWGRIIFISSESAINIPEEMIHYGMTKTAQLSISRGLAELTKHTNVTVNSVLPGPTLSEGVGGFIEGLATKQNKSIEQVEDDFFKEMRPSSILQRFISPQEIANMVCYIASPLAAGTNGSAIRVDGGVVKSII